MTRLGSKTKVSRIEGWIGGVQEDAPPGVPEGVLDSSSEFFFTPPGKLAVRGGSQVKRSLTSANKTLLIRPFTPVGAVAVAHADGSTQHYAWRLTTDMAFFTGVEATSKHAFWTSAVTARPVTAELFEKLYFADANTDFSAREPMMSMDSTGAFTLPTYDLGGGAEALKPYCLEEYNNVLFIASYDNKTAGADAAALVRHSLLGTAPDGAGGFDALAYNTIGAKGQRVTAMKKGKGLLLIAKANELHRLSGFGKALPGWQYQVEGVDNELGAGCSNPLALCYAEGWWYGTGEAGPFRTDGFQVQSLVGARRRSWSSITSLPYAWTQYHPDRNCVLFGLTEVPPVAGRSSTYPNVIWVWDCEREVWAGDIRCSADLYYAHAIPTATVQGPIGVPSALVFDHASATLTSVAASWTNGDATAATEVWIRDVTNGGTYFLWTTAAAGVTSASITGLTNGVNYKAKIRHIKSGTASAYSAEVDGYTLLPAPSLSFTTHGNIFTAVVSIAHGAVTFEKGGVQYNSVAVTAVGSYISSAAGPGTFSYRSRCFESTWPVAIQGSAYSGTLVVTT